MTKYTSKLTQIFLFLFFFRRGSIKKFGSTRNSAWDKTGFGFHNNTFQVILFSDSRKWLLCDKTETLSKACVTLSQFGALKEETIVLKSDKKRIQNNSIFFLFFLRRGNIKKFGSEPKLNVRQNKALSIRPCKIEAFGSVLWGVEKLINWHILSN